VSSSASSPPEPECTGSDTAYGFFDGFSTPFDGSGNNAWGWWSTFTLEELEAAGPAGISGDLIAGAGQGTPESGTDVGTVNIVLERTDTTATITVTTTTTSNFEFTNTHMYLDNQQPGPSRPPNGQLGFQEADGTYVKTNTDTDSTGDVFTYLLEDGVIYLILHADIVCASSAPPGR